MKFDDWGSICSIIDFELTYGQGADESILVLDKVANTVTLAPSFASVPETYEKNYLRFFYEDFPEVFMDVQIIATVEPCVSA